jgi:hypothetical protein
MIFNTKLLSYALIIMFMSNIEFAWSTPNIMIFCYMCLCQYLSLIVFEQINHCHCHCIHAHLQVSAWLAFLFVFSSSEIQYSLFLFILRICSAFPSSVRNVLRTVYSHSHEMHKRFSELTLDSVEWRTKLFYFICGFMSDIF